MLSDFNYNRLEFLFNNFQTHYTDGFDKYKKELNISESLDDLILSSGAPTSNPSKDEILRFLCHLFDQPLDTASFARDQGFFSLAIFFDQWARLLEIDKYLTIDRKILVMLGWCEIANAQIKERDGKPFILRKKLIELAQKSFSKMNTTGGDGV